MLLNEAPSGSIIICDNTTYVRFQLRNISSSNASAGIFIFDDFIHYSIIFRAPGIVITSKDASALIKYMQTVVNPMASIKFQETFVGTKPAPAVAAFTSRGLAPSFLRILKPNLMAAGFLVLAAYIPNIYVTEIGNNIFLSTDFVVISGTSMACPHVSGIAALLENAHPE
ncbi:hypothetical protein LguiA_003928 [Lonicera macranthoides]